MAAFNSEKLTNRPELGEEYERSKHASILKGQRMKFDDFICSEAINVELKANDIQGVVHEMAQALLDAGQLAKDQFGNIVKAIMKREELGSTGVGRGVAIPHAKHKGVKQTLGTVAISRNGVDFASLDGEPTYVFFLLISPADGQDSHFRVLQKIAVLVRNESFCRFLRQAKSVADIKQLLNEADNDRF